MHCSSTFDQSIKRNGNVKANNTEWSQIFYYWHGIRANPI